MKKILIIIIIAALFYFLLDAIVYLFSGITSNLSFLFFLFALSLFFITRNKNFSIFLISIFLIELGLSLFSPYKSYAERNGDWSFTAPFFKHDYAEPYQENHYDEDENPEFNFTHTFNDIGYEDANVGEREHFKAFILGDSFIQGLGVDNSESIDKQLEEKANCDNCILNMGLSGSELKNHLKLLKELHNKSFSADFVIS